MDELQGYRRSGGLMRPMLATALGSFLLGGIAMGYYFYNTDREEAVPAAEPSLQAVAGPSARRPAPTPSATSSRAAQAVARVAEQQGGIDQRLAAAEQRLARLDLQAQAAAGNAARAESLLIAFAARRTLERGLELGYLGDQLRLRFGDAMPNAVATILAHSRNPVTRDQLIARLEGRSPELLKHTQKPALERIGDELGQLFVVRRESAPSPQPQRRLERARLFLESGRVGAAIAEVRNMPGAAGADNWLRDARRFADAQAALDLLETAAVMDPRRMRDGNGQPIEQPGLTGN